MEQAPGMDEGSLTLDEMLQAELGRANALAGSLGQLLRHLLANDDRLLLSDEIIARMRGMVGSLARQLLQAHAKGAGLSEPDSRRDGVQGRLVGTLLENGPFLGHLHALALEWQLTSRLQVQRGIDPALTPLLQAQLASADAATSQLAKSALVSQARFAQQQRRMDLALGELPADLFAVALRALRQEVGESDSGCEHACDELRRAFDEADSRIGLISRLIMRMGYGTGQALSIEHAGVAVFVTAVAIATGLPRDLAILSTNEPQHVRLLLALRAAGLGSAAIEEQFACLHPGTAGLPGEFGSLHHERASELLAAFRTNQAA